MQVYSLQRAYLLWGIAGFTGAHHFYLRQPKRGTVFAGMFLAVSVGLFFFSITFRYTFADALHRHASENIEILISLALIQFLMWLVDGFLIRRMVNKANTDHRQWEKDTKI